MFAQARIKLTAWYLVIIMCISIMFSVVIYRVLFHEVERFERLQRFRIERRLGRGSTHPSLTNPELLEETKQRILIMLFFVNAGILVMAGCFGYMLAGRTLAPIKDMMDEQNQFISDASHELRTPLTSLKSTMEVYLRDKNLTLADSKRVMSQNIEDVNKLQSLTDALLQLTQYQKPNGIVVFEKVSILEIVQEAIRRVHPFAIKKHIVIHNKINDYTCIGNKVGLIDVVVIFFDNALKYSSNKKEITVTTVKKDGFIDLSVQDHGIGIDQKDISHIFDRFYRADTARTKIKTGGYGLGLSIAKNIVKAHGGTITVASKPREGSTFTIHIPIK